MANSAEPPYFVRSDYFSLEIHIILFGDLNNSREALKVSYTVKTVGLEYSDMTPGFEIVWNESWTSDLWAELAEVEVPPAEVKLLVQHPPFIAPSCLAPGAGWALWPCPQPAPPTRNHRSVQRWAWLPCQVKSSFANCFAGPHLNSHASICLNPAWNARLCYQHPAEQEQHPAAAGAGQT